MYACDLLEGTKEKDWTEIDPFKIAKPPKWCSKIWFLLHIRQVLIITYICHQRWGNALRIITRYVIYITILKLK